MPLFGNKAHFEFNGGLVAWTGKKNYVIQIKSSLISILQQIKLSGLSSDHI